VEERLVFQAVFEKLTKDRDGEIVLSFKVPLTEEQKVREIPVQQVINLVVVDNV